MNQVAQSQNNEQAYFPLSYKDSSIVKDALREGRAFLIRKGVLKK